MLNWKRVTLIAAFSTSISLAVLPESCQAGWLRDWLEYRRCVRAQRRTFFRGGLFGGRLCGTNTLCRPSCQTTCQRTVVQYVPQVAYRTVWQRVPVTVYRPVTATDPCTCCRTVSYQPCTTHQWQAQRVAYTTYQPVATTVAVPAPSCCNTVGAPVTPTYAVSAPSSGCSTCAPSTSAVVPMPAQPSTVVPSPNGFAPVPGSGGQGIMVPSQGVPTTPPSDADIRPQLPTSQFSPESGIQGSDSRYRLEYIPPQKTPAVGTSVTPGPPPAYGTQLTPIPDLDGEESNEAPRLIKPHDRTASSSPIRLVGTYRELESSESGSPKQPTKDNSEPIHWDDSGWESEGR